MLSTTKKIQSLPEIVILWGFMIHRYNSFFLLPNHCQVYLFYYTFQSTCHSQWVLCRCISNNNANKS